MERIKRIPLRSTELKAKEKKNIRRILYIVAAIAAALIVIYVIYKSNNAVYHSYKVEEGATWPASAYNEYLPYKNGILRYNRDGAEAKTSNGTAIWNVSYNMKDPIAAVRGAYAVIADRGNKELIIIGSAGIENRLQLLHNIMFVSISEQGVAAVVTDNGMENILYLYTPDSTDQDNWTAQGSTNVLSNGFPLDVVISPDGKKTLSSYLRIQEDNITTWAVFHNYGEVGQSYQDRLVGGYKNTSFAATAHFINASTAIVLQEDGFQLYTIPEIPDDPVTVTISEEIQQIAYSTTMICVLVKNNDEKGRQKVYCYNLKGKKLSEFYMQDKYEEVMTSGGDIVFYNSTSFYICDKKGVLKMQGELEKSCEYIYPLNNEDKYLLVGEGYMDILKLLQSE